MQLRNRQDFWSGVMFIVLGLGFSWQASSYQMGTAARMGPGYFPFWLGLVLALLGAIVLISALSKKATETAVEGFDWRIVFLVVGSVVLYALILKPLGVYLSVFVLVVVSSLASHEFSWKVAVANGIFLVVFSYLAFIKGLGLIFPLWPSFLGMN
ncbi:tripartite tricarboxylate transporter TctB family protein [Bordetella bronchiseptica]|uniref:Membrane protein n=4 Tax=Bordetella bronchiseptica TaxID=518 RepID=A0A0H3LWM1_BORBR|nr:tripartite tricarboxylate transporter TctB family protein [Bordetella bronchiseptica]KAK61100.1 tripartite tricarboxylate transporter TctB family protein [Bordetella bronchiseptica 980-2]SHS66248.1 Tripartite tricarboxylate transporter TctB family [Mycobacteroides abscessus subsp. abscessus]AMG90224.1 tripartite tricarboxylate transporter TctB family protein [Bordetella bronchiseptica]AWP76730.1 tricarboxylate transporter [Bordetella bronchiseptica]AWP81580.1 tricarboxylate transporter [Bor